MRTLYKIPTIALALLVVVAIALFCWPPLPGCRPPIYMVPERLAIAPDGRFAYLSDSDAKRLLVFSLADNRLAANLPLPASTREIAISRDGAKVYLLSYGPPGQVLVVDAASKQLERTFGIDGNPEGLALGADGRQLYTVQAGFHRLVSLDAGSGQVVAAVPFEDGGAGLAVTADGKSLVVGHLHGVTVFDARSLHGSANYDTKDAAGNFALSPDSTKLAYAVGGSETGVRLLDLASGAIEKRATLGLARETAFTRDGASVIASNVMMPHEKHGSLSVMPARIPQEVKGAIVPSIPPDRSVSLALDKFPHAIAIDAKRNRIDVIAIPLQGMPTVEVLDGTTHRVLDQIPLPDAKNWVDKFMAWRASVLRPVDRPQCL
jgi:DNA-binding beta-propeller fold protein YncE